MPKCQPYSHKCLLTITSQSDLLDNYDDTYKKFGFNRLEALQTSYIYCVHIYTVCRGWRVQSIPNVQAVHRLHNLQHMKREHKVQNNKRIKMLSVNTGGSVCSGGGDDPCHLFMRQGRRKTHAPVSVCYICSVCCWSGGGWGRWGGGSPRYKTMNYECLRQLNSLLSTIF